MWSEYKVTFAQSDTLVDFLFSKGYYPSEMNSKYFTFDPFQNYKSHDLETRHIGFLNHTKQIIYMTEDRFHAINQALSGVTPDILEYAFSKQNKGQEQDTIVILKRGIYLRFIGNNFRFRIDCGGRGHIDFDPLRGDEKMCQLDLVKILEDERIGWVPVTVPEVPKVPEVPTVPEVLKVPEVAFSHEDVLNAALKRNIVKSAVSKFKQSYSQVREDVKHREIRNGWLN